MGNRQSEATLTPAALPSPMATPAAPPQGLRDLDADDLNEIVILVATNPQFTPLTDEIIREEKWRRSWYQSGSKLTQEMWLRQKAMAKKAKKDPFAQLSLEQLTGALEKCDIIHKMHAASDSATDPSEWSDKILSIRYACDVPMHSDPEEEGLTKAAPEDVRRRLEWLEANFSKEKQEKLERLQAQIDKSVDIRVFLSANPAFPKEGLFKLQGRERQLKFLREHFISFRLRELLGSRAYDPSEYAKMSDCNCEVVKDGPDIISCPYWRVLGRDRRFKPGNKICWKSSYLWHAREAAERSGIMFQAKESDGVLGEGQQTEREMAKRLNLKIITVNESNLDDIARRFAC